MVISRLHTADDLKELAASERDFELIAGELIPMVPPSFRHGKVQAKVASLLLQHVATNDLGAVVVESGFKLARDPDTVLAPDVAFVSMIRIPADTSGFVELAPDLAVEIVSPANTPGEIERKIGIYLIAGVQQVWIVYPEEREVVVHVPSGPPRVFTEQDHLDGGETLPELDLAVVDIFA